MKKPMLKCDHAGKGSNGCFYINEPGKKCLHSRRHTRHEFSECNVITRCFQVEGPVACVEVEIKKGEEK